MTSTRLVSYVFENTNTQHRIYFDANYHVMALWWDNNGWHYNDLTLAAGDPTGAAPGTPLVGYAFENTNTQHVMHVDEYLRQPSGLPRPATRRFGGQSTVSRRASSHKVLTFSWPALFGSEPFHIERVWYHKDW